MKFLLPLFSSILVAAVASSSVWAEDAPPVRKVTVSGSATIKVVPDQMLWSVAVSINDAALAKAKAQHDVSLKALVDYLKSLGSVVQDLQTGGITFEKNEYDKDSPLRLKPFSCSTQVTFTLTDFDKYGPIADMLAKIDGVQAQGVSYAYAKQADVQRDALKQSLQNAHEKAADLAATANCTIDRPLSVEEQEGFSGMRPVTLSYASRSADNGTPAPVAGQIEISAKVTASYDLTPK